MGQSTSKVNQKGATMGKNKTKVRKRAASEIGSMLSAVPPEDTGLRRYGNSAVASKLCANFSVVLPVTTEQTTACRSTYLAPFTASHFAMNTNTPYFTVLYHPSPSSSWAANIHWSVWAKKNVGRSLLIHSFSWLCINCTPYELSKHQALRHSHVLQAHKKYREQDPPLTQ